MMVASLNDSTTECTWGGYSDSCATYIYIRVPYIADETEKQKRINYNNKKFYPEYRNRFYCRNNNKQMESSVYNQYRS